MGFFFVICHSIRSFQESLKKLPSGNPFVDEVPALDPKLNGSLVDNATRNFSAAVEFIFNNYITGSIKKLSATFELSTV